MPALKRLPLRSKQFLLAKFKERLYESVSFFMPIGEVISSIRYCRHEWSTADERIENQVAKLGEEKYHALIPIYATTIFDASFSV